MTQAINTQVVAALTAAGAYQGAIAKLQAALRGHDVPTVRATLLPHVAAYYKVALVAKERGEGVTMDTEAPKFEAAKKALQRLTADVVGKSVAQVADVTLTRAQMAAIRACHEAGVTMKMFGQGVKKLAK